jgi:hypothetical protein
MYNFKKKSRQKKFKKNQLIKVDLMITEKIRNNIIKISKNSKLNQLYTDLKSVLEDIKNDEDYKFYKGAITNEKTSRLCKDIAIEAMYDLLSAEFDIVSEMIEVIEEEIEKHP